MCKGLDVILGLSGTRGMIVVMNKGGGQKNHKITKSENLFLKKYSDISNLNII